MIVSRKSCFVTGVDKNQQWLLPWWLSNICRHNEQDIVICDFGMTEEWSKWAEERADAFIKFPVREQCAWFYKPLALWKTAYSKKCWIDLDCEVLGDISGIFDYTERDKITCAEDIHHSWGCKYQTGVFAVENNSRILEVWAHRCINLTNRGDQEILWDTVKDYPNTIARLPDEYNWLRLDVENQREYKVEPKIIHWTGDKGKKIIQEKIGK